MLNRIGITTDDKRALLRRAWQSAPADANSLSDELNKYLAAAQGIVEENLSSSASNGHSSTSNQPGQNSATDAELARAWSQIIEGFKMAREYLRNCAKYGLDAFTVQAAGIFPSPLPEKIEPAEARVTVDANDLWEALAGREDIALDLIVGAIVGDEAIFCWLVANPLLLNATGNNEGTRGDYSQAIIGRTGGAVW